MFRGAQKTHFLLKFIAAALFITFASSLGAHSVAAESFDPESIIDDTVFTNKNSMSAAQIQQFLESKVPVCDTYGTKTSEYGGGTRAQWGQANYGQSTFTCLRDYIEGGKKASQIIYDVSQLYTINPQVLLVLLQKEQALVTDNWPLNLQYRNATGYGCPDTAPCDTQYYGFTNQVSWAARMFRAILNDSPTWHKKYYPYWVTDPNTQATGPRYVQFNPTQSCGGTWLNIQNRSTQALYSYTPYQPNPATLSAPMGVTVDCGAYGNINFYRYFTQWFGTVRGYVSLETPRWMQLRVNSNKLSPSANVVVMGPLTKGTQLKFTSKVLSRDTWYLRSEYDTVNNLDRGIAINDLDEIPYQNITGTTMELTTNTNKRDPLTDKNYPDQALKAGNQLIVADTISVNDQLYYRSLYDKQTGNSLGVPASALRPIPFQDFENPRYMQIKKDLKRINPLTGVFDSSVIQKDTQYKFVSKIFVSGSWYYRTEQDTQSNTALGINADNITEVTYVSLPDGPQWLQLKTAADKIDSATGSVVDYRLPKGTQLELASSLTINGTLYYRTSYDTDYNMAKIIQADKFEAIPFIPLENPRNFTLGVNSYKRDPSTKKVVDGPFEKGSSIKFSSKVLINNQWYYRTDFDTANDFYRAISISDLE